MNLAFSLNRFESINFQRFLRRNAVTRAVYCGKIALALCAVASLVALTYYVYALSRATDTQLSDFKQRLESQNAPSETTAPKKEPKQFGIIAQKAIFGSLGQPTTPQAKPTPRPGASTQFSLIGTFVSPGQASFAIIEEQKKKQQEVFLLSDSVFGEAKLTAILSDRVEINRNGQTEVLMLDTGPDTSGPVEGGVALTSADEYAVDEAELDKALENLPLLLTQARAVPFFKEGRAVGLRLFAIRAGSLFEKIGLQNGDVLKTVNGNSLADLSQAMTLFQKLKDERSIGLVLERNSVERQMRYQIK